MSDERENIVNKDDDDILAMLGDDEDYDNPPETGTMDDLDEFDEDFDAVDEVEEGFDEVEDGTVEDIDSDFGDSVFDDTTLEPDSEFDDDSLADSEPDEAVQSFDEFDLEFGENAPDASSEIIDITAIPSEEGTTDSDTSEIEDSEPDTYENHLPGEVEMDDATKADFDNTFSGEEQLEMLFNGIKGKFRTEMKAIPVDSIILPKAKKESRRRTIIGLTGLVSTLSGVVTPVHVMTLEDSDDEYILLDGARRLYSAIKSGITEVNAVIWDFDDKDEGKSLANILSLVLNRSQQFKNEELWKTMRVLETVNNCTPGKIEYLLQMQSGDAMKLKDIMLAEGGDEVVELKEKFMNDEISIESAYKKLTSIRKKENRLERDEERELDFGQEAAAAAGDLDAGQGTTPEGGSGSGDSKARLSNEEVLELLEMGEEDVTEQSIAELKAKGDELRAGLNEPHVQDVHNRHPVDPEIKRKTFERDGYKCVCCGTGEELYLSILVFHHKVPVFCGGPDTVDNGLTLCANCHLMIHNFADGHLHGDILSYDEDTQLVLKKIMAYGTLIMRAALKMGLKHADVHKLDADSRKHMMPNKNVKGNDEVFTKSQSEAVESSEDFDRDLEENTDSEEAD